MKVSKTAILLLAMLQGGAYAIDPCPISEDTNRYYVCLGTKKLFEKKQWNTTVIDGLYDKVKTTYVSIWPIEKQLERTPGNPALQRQLVSNAQELRDVLEDTCRQAALIYLRCRTLDQVAEDVNFNQVEIMKYLARDTLSYMQVKKFAGVKESDTLLDFIPTDVRAGLANVFTMWWGSSSVDIAELVWCK
ncbi:MAG: hypothetical protein LBJ92_04375 [Holosporales bacterium]|jgi:hypothetical protein|nr:hypothetical protein [Holosporales bacterium]